MELRQLANIMRRRWLWVIIPAVVVLILGVVTYRPAPPVYNAGVRFITAQPPAPESELYDEQRYYNWLTSEYIVNGLADWVRGGRFAELVSAYLASTGESIPPWEIQGAIAADNARSMLTISLTGSSTPRVAAMMDGVIAVLVEQNAAGLPQLNGQNAELVQLDTPSVNQVPGGLMGQLDLPLRVALAVAAGMGLGLLVEYLDPTVRQRRDIQHLELDVLGEIPPEKRRTRGT